VLKNRAFFFKCSQMRPADLFVRTFETGNPRGTFRGGGRGRVADDGDGSGGASAGPRRQLSFGEEKKKRREKKGSRARRAPCRDQRERIGRAMAVRASKDDARESRGLRRLWPIGRPMRQGHDEATVGCDKVASTCKKKKEKFKKRNGGRYRKEFSAAIVEPGGTGGGAWHSFTKKLRNYGAPAVSAGRKRVLGELI